jgi:lipoprotein-anchoring transpeptidase ErfK/SrfK
MRAIVFVTVALMLDGCMQGTLAPATQAGWTGRDKQLIANLPYRHATIPEEFSRHIVEYSRKEAPGTIVVDTGNKFLYYVRPKGQAIAMASPSAKLGRPGAASPPSAARKNGHPGHRPPANTRALTHCQPS